MCPEGQKMSTYTISLYCRSRLSKRKLKYYFLIELICFKLIMSVLKGIKTCSIIQILLCLLLAPCNKKVSAYSKILLEIPYILTWQNYRVVRSTLGQQITILDSHNYIFEYNNTKLLIYLNFLGQPMTGKLFRILTKKFTMLHLLFWHQISGNH